MKVKVNGQEAYFTTSGREIDQSQPTIVFVHGSGLTHVTWVLQTRYFAFHGYNTIAVDLPGHGDSEGPALKTIEEMADWMASLLNVLEINKISYVGHSQGCLVGLEFAYRYADKLDLLVLINGSLSMKMNPELLQLALDKNHKAVDLMMDWVHGPLGQVGGHPVPGLSHIGMGNQLVSANNNGGTPAVEVHPIGARLGGEFGRAYPLLDVVGRNLHTEVALVCCASEPCLLLTITLEQHSSEDHLAHGDLHAKVRTESAVREIAPSCERRQHHLPLEPRSKRVWPHHNAACATPARDLKL